MGSDLDTEMVNLIYSDIAYLSWMMFWNEDVFARMQIKYESFKIARSYICVYLHTVQASAVWVESQPYMLDKFMAVKYVYFSQELSTMEPHSVLIRQSPAHNSLIGVCSFLIGCSPLSHNFTPLNSLLVCSSLLFVILTIFVTVLMMSLSAGLRKF